MSEPTRKNPADKFLTEAQYRAALDEIDTLTRAQISEPSREQAQRVAALRTLVVSYQERRAIPEDVWASDPINGPGGPVWVSDCPTRVGRARLYQVTGIGKRPKSIEIDLAQAESVMSDLGRWIARERKRRQDAEEAEQLLSPAEADPPTPETC